MTQLGTPLAALAHRAATDPDAVTVVTGDGSWTARDLLAAVESSARRLRQRGVSAGDRVVLQAANSPKLVAAYLACFHVGAVAAPLNTRYSAPELEARLAVIDPHLYVGDNAAIERVGPRTPLPTNCDRTSLDQLCAAVDETDGDVGPVLLETTAQPTPPDAPAVLLETTGSTGPPKLSVWTPRVLAGIGSVAARRGVDADGVVAATLPMMHNSGLSLLTACLLQGATMVIISPFDADAVLDAIETHRITQLTGLPAMCAQLAHAQRARPRDLSSLRMCLVGGDVCPPHVENEFAAVVGRPLLSHWVATEEVSATVPEPLAGPVCRLLDDVEVRVLDDEDGPVPAGEVGRLFTRSPRTIPGYWQQDGTIHGLADGWFDSGDLVAVDGRQMRYAGRVKDVIVSGGSKISPVEVERVLQGHAAVRSAAVVGLPDPEIGQRVVAAVVLAAGGSTRDLDSVWQTVRDCLADWKQPTELNVLDELPRNALSKVDREAVTALLARQG